ncbi:hypothetical protein LFL96_10710 [Paraburkholderia sp. D15]|uniref:hypothetical protein n=1 Tax=Paraburkholderia sp. D15 TaxID=2880218 RepID=UPI002479951D|nr:hypothetical protein [Paraburkholderia sp. D15]WGS48277.1 hypothetical protein LFL96_10710 [Paraburkholderia sp. D15]
MASTPWVAKKVSRNETAKRVDETRLRSNHEATPKRPRGLALALGWHWALRLSIEQIARPILRTRTIYTDRFVTSKSVWTIFKTFAARSGISATNGFIRRLSRAIKDRHRENTADK